MKRPLPFCAVIALAAALVTAPSEVSAAGVLAGTTIQNTATADYQSGGVPQSVNSNTVSVRIDELLDVAVASLDSGAVPVTGSAVLAFSVTNPGNGPEAFVLTADPAQSGNDFDVTVNSLAIDSNGNGVYDAGTDALLANGATSSLIAPDASLIVFVLVTSPASSTNGQTSQVELLAQAATGTGAPGTVFAGVGEGGGDAVVGASGADDTALGSLVVAKATVALVKSAVVSDPFGGSQPVPGATIRYTIVATAAGTGSVSGLRVVDATPTGTTYQPGTLALEGATLTDATDGDAGEASAVGVAVTIGNLAAGDSRTIAFTVAIQN